MEQKTKGEIPPELHWENKTYQPKRSINNAACCLEIEVRGKFQQSDKKNASHSIEYLLAKKKNLQISSLQKVRTLREKSSLQPGWCATLYIQTQCIPLVTFHVIRQGYFHTWCPSTRAWAPAQNILSSQLSWVPDM